MTSFRTQLVVISVQFRPLLNHLELKTPYKCELLPETETKPYILYNWIILHANLYSSSAVPSTSSHSAEHKRIFFTYGTELVALISQIKIGISFENKRQFMSARWDTIHEYNNITSNILVFINNHVKTSQLSNEYTLARYLSISFTLWLISAMVLLKSYFWSIWICILVKMII